MIDRRSLSCFARMSPARDSSSSMLLLDDGDRGMQGRQQQRNRQGDTDDDQDKGQDSGQDNECDAGGTRSKSCFPASFLQSWLLSLLLARRLWPGFVCPRGNKNRNVSDAADQDPERVAPAMVANAALWKKMMSVVESRRRQVVAVTLGKKKKERIDFAYDEHSYAKNFDMGRENWIKYDPCLAPVWRSRTAVLQGSTSSSSSSSIRM